MQAQLHQGQPISPVLLHEFGWSAAIQRCHQFGEAPHHLSEIAVGGLIDRINAGTRDVVAIQYQMVAVGLQRDGRFGFAKSQTSPLEIKIFDDALIKLGEPLCAV